MGKYGPKTAPEVSNALKIQRTEIYQILNTLGNKGIVSATFDHPTRFSATPLESAILALVNAQKERLKTLEMQRNELVDLWNRIPDFQISANEIGKEDKFQMLKGTNQIMSQVKKVLGNAKKSLLVLGSEKFLMRLYNSDSLEHLPNSRADIKLLASCSQNAMHILAELAQTKIKKIPERIKNELCYILKDDDELLLFMRNGEQSAHDMTAMWTNSVSMIGTMRLLFHYIWSSSKSVG